MTDLHTLKDAFTELERRADAVPATTSLPSRTSLPAQRRRAGLPRLVPVAAGLAVVLAVGAGAVLLDRDAPGGGTTAAQQRTTSAPAPAPSFTVPMTPEDLAARFRSVLGDTATFVVTETGAPVGAVAGQDGPAVPIGAAIVGTITAGGVTGGFDLQWYPQPGSEPYCDAASNCATSDLPDGSRVAAGQFQHESGSGVTYSLNLVRPDGSVFLMHVSNARSPKGASEVLGDRPPLTIDQLRAIATSDRW
jgi:hypothetical protein